MTIVIPIIVSGTIIQNKVKKGSVTHLVPNKFGHQTFSPLQLVPSTIGPMDIWYLWTFSPQDYWYLWINSPHTFNPPGQTVSKILGHFNRLAIFVFDIFTAMIHPIRLHFKLIVANVVRKKIIKENNKSLALAFQQNTKTIQQIEKESCEHVRLQHGLETIYQLAIGIILLFYASSNTRTSQGLSALSESENINIFGFSMSPILLLTINVMLNFLSFSIANINGIRSESYFPIKSKLMLAVSILCSVAAQIMSITLYFAPSLGLFDLLFHYKGKTN